MSKREGSHLERVQLDIGIAMGQALDQALYRLLGSVLVAGNSIANLHDGTPVLGRKVLIGRLVWEVKLLVSAAPQLRDMSFAGNLLMASS
jgi:hypothetical protein